MTDTAPQNFKATDQGAESSVQKTPEATKRDGVIAGKPNQEIYGLANTVKHQHDRTLSEPDMIAMEENESVVAYNARVAQIQANRCGFYDSAEKGNGSAAETGMIIDYQHEKIGKNIYAGGMDYEEGRDIRSIYEKLTDFGKAAAVRALDHEGQKIYIQGQLDKIVGIGEGLNTAKESTKEAVVAGSTALTNGTVANFLSKPNAINDPLFQAVGGVLDAIAKDPNTVNHALERVGTIIMQGSERYPAAPNREKGHVIGETMFALVNPEGSTEAGQAALKVADRIATHVDKAVMDGIQKSMKATEEMAAATPELAQQAKQMLHDYTKILGLSPQEMELAGIPKGYFDGMQSPAGKGDSFFAMSKADDLSDVRPKRTGGGVEREPAPEKFKPSERFKAELTRALERLSEGEKANLKINDTAIQPVKRLTDILPGTEGLGACYSPEQKTIFVPQEIMRLGKWTANNDVEFALSHEVGHVFNVKANVLSEHYVSDTKIFRSLFQTEKENIPTDILNSLQLPEDAVKARDEIFADLYAHAKGMNSDNPYSQLVKHWFPNALKFVEEIPKW